MYKLFVIKIILNYYYNYFQKNLTMLSKLCIGDEQNMDVY